MTYLIRIRDWYLTRFGGASRRGKLALLAVPLLLACCGVSFLSTLISPPDDPTPTAEVAARAATVELAVAEPTDEPPAATDEPTAAPSPTPRPTNTARPTVAPTATDEPTQPPARAATMGAATALFATAAAQPTAAPATATSAPAPTAAPTLAAPTAIPPTAAPTQPPPQPTATLPAAAGSLVIIGLDKRAEVVTIRNDGGAEVNLGGWVLRSEKGSQDCALGGVIGPSQTLQIWALAENAGNGGYNCGFGSNIWNNDDPDAALLIDPTGAVVSRW